MAETMLSLVSNPHDPFDEYDLWILFDHHEGFDTAGLLARTLDLNLVTEEFATDAEVERTIDQIVSNPSYQGMYKKVVRA